ncbi:ribulokinase [Flagellimonas algicola]|uniref:Ribulokinase n=1 Tax=Flagellimonas algicola TaxID=2583815 RepID=A0ABY2WIX8_9FLAO|nr:ribulokinase [Allomuricauda algicola]TMU54602.1 ribulokinase [Allomuricauda algicola]
MPDQYVIGVDFGTDSVRSLLVNAKNGQTLGTEVHWYARWKEGYYCDSSKNQYRQHTLDHLEGMEWVIREVVKNAGVDPQTIQGICIDTTGSSPQALDKQGTPLCLKDGFKDNPNAMMILWKDHTAIHEANEINAVANQWATNYTEFVGGIYSSEWFWAKMLHICRTDHAVKSEAYTWMEHCDLMTYILIGSPPLDSFKYSRCAAGHKAMWHANWDGLPDSSFLSTLDPYLGQVRDRLYAQTYTSNQKAGNLCEEWANKLGLTTSTVVSVGTFDAHAGAVGAEVSANTLVRVMGTSTCDITVCDEHVIGGKAVKGICGQVNGSVIPGMIGLEAGQSAFGDVLAWFKDVLMEPTRDIIQQSEDIDVAQKEKLIKKLEDDMIKNLSEQAAALTPEDTAPVALDWINGRRTPDANQLLKSAIVNLSLGTSAAHIFKSLVEAICFGSKKIINRFEEEGIAIDSVIGIGGVAQKSSFVMQTLANVLNMPIKISASKQTPALGAAMYASVAAGIHNSVPKAIQTMGQGFRTTYMPREKEVNTYKKMFAEYEILASFVESQE